MESYIPALVAFGVLGTIVATAFALVALAFIIWRIIKVIIARRS